MKQFEMMPECSRLIKEAGEFTKGKKRLNAKHKLALKAEKYVLKKHDNFDVFMKEIKDSKIEELEDLLKENLIFVSQV